MEMEIWRTRHAVAIIHGRLFKMGSEPACGLLCATLMHGSDDDVAVACVQLCVWTMGV